jgi:hypothetical protein
MSQVLRPASLKTSAMSECQWELLSALTSGIGMAGVIAAPSCQKMSQMAAVHAAYVEQCAIERQWLSGVCTAADI